MSLYRISIPNMRNEHDLHLFVKRAQLDGISFGDATWHRDRLGRLLRSKIEAGQPLL